MIWSLIAAQTRVFSAPIKKTVTTVTSYTIHLDLITDEKYGEKSANCAICIDDFCEGDIVVGSIDHIECSHIFHFDCILAWLSKYTGDSDNYYCPVCRHAQKIHR